ncbi:MAG: DUF1624 domain-containing protein [Oscillospiraceae bacterium]|nr:DUF1624 domain-containing protein [Oscillospiraceae bacterium]
MKQRIWELDAFRGICIIGMVIVHFVYDMVDLYGLADWDLPALFLFVQQWGGVLFLLISGICATLGSHSVKRGLVVFGCGLLVSAVTVGMYVTEFAGIGIIIYFGVLHCLGTCMILWPAFKKLPVWVLVLIGSVLVLLGFHLQTMPTVDYPWLVPIGILPHNFASSDYFPLLPNLGFFLLGAAIGRTAYRKKETLLPKVNANHPVLRFLRFCGKYSLWIYLIHQPILSAAIFLITLVK